MAIYSRYAYVDDDDPSLGRQAAAYRNYAGLHGKQARRGRALTRLEANLAEAQRDLELLHAYIRKFDEELRDGTLSPATIESLQTRKQKADAEIETLRAKMARMQSDAQTLRSRLKQY